METNREELVSLIKKLEKSNTKILGIIPREENSELEKYFLSEINDYNEAETGENNAMFVNKTANKDKN
ncbi:MAG: hypothetical protein MZU84_03725 [Sphingobacterium sp.]|nr:hypothetical protein [Sphingobacterium sp.]